MKFLPLFYLLALIVLLTQATTTQAAPPETQGDFYVSPDGKDSWSGRLPKPNRAKTDGPFASLARAKRAVRERGLVSTGPASVLIRGGFYVLTETIVFTLDDLPATYAAYPGEKPVLSGGTRLTGRKAETGGHWTFPCPERTEQLYVNEERRYRPRLPKTGYYQIAMNVPATEKNAKEGYDRFRFRPGDIRPDFSSLGEIEVMPFHIWTMSRFRIASVNTEESTVTLAGRTIGTDYFTDLGRGRRYLLENVKEALTEPGEWYWDSQTRQLTYLPKPDEDAAKTEIIAPRLPSLLEIRGEAGKNVQGLTFRGLTFAHSAWQLPEGGHSWWQAETNLPAAISINYGSNIVLTQCIVRNTGAWGVHFGIGSKNCRLEGCALYDLGAGAIRLGETEYTDDAAKHSGNHAIIDCYIAQGGRVHPAAIGVWIGQSAHNTVEHCEITDFYYSAVSVGWTWGYGPSGAHHNRIAHCHLYNLGQTVLSDMGAIYTLGVSPGTTLADNKIHDIDSFDYGGWGIYFDEGSQGVIAENNLVYSTKSAPFHQHYGRENIVRNNIFAYGREAQLMRTRAEDHLSFTFLHNIVYWKTGPLLGSNWTGNNFALSQNLYWQAKGEGVNFAGASLADWQAKGFDKGSLIADPRFVNPEKNDFTLLPGSPAPKIGFVPLDLSTVGPRKERLVTFVRPKTPAPAFPLTDFSQPNPIRDDFEEFRAGESPHGKGITVSEEKEIPTATIRATEETAASGKISLKFADAPGQKAVYNPHLYYRPSTRTGTVVGRFALHWEKGAVVQHEWRDASLPHHTGPSLTVSKSGTLSARDKVLTELPEGVWVIVEITCGLGAQSTGTYDLTLRFPGRTAPLTYQGLPGDVDFRELHWFGFISLSNENAVFYVDDIVLRPVK